MARKKKSKGRKAPSRRRALKLGVASAVFIGVWGLCGEWFVHHPREWFDDCRFPKPIATSLFWIGNPLADLTDAIGLTGHDAVYEYDTEAPSGTVTFGGLPRRVGAPAPDDIRILKRGEFVIGWSDKLRHPLWCAYHVIPEARYDVGDRPGFVKDRSLARSPVANDYTKSGYDRGHMAPNYAIATRYGDEERRKTFMMSNVAPQSPALNRGVWRDVEHRIADLWTARYGEIWVVVGCIPGNGEVISGTGIDVPTGFYQIIIAQENMDVRALAVLFEQNVGWNEWAARHIVSIDRIEELTGLDFNPDVPGFLQDPLEAEIPSRLWPIRKRDLLGLFALRFTR